MNTKPSTKSLLACATLLAVALSGCTSADDADALAAGKTIDMKDFKYVGATVTVAAGTTVKWTNSDAVMHTVTAEDGSFDSGDIDAGDSWTHTFTKPGTYLYYCKPHATEGSDGHMQGMVAKLIVQ